MKNSLTWAIAISIFILAFAINFAIADVTGAGATTNTQSTTGSSATNTAISQVLLHQRPPTTQPQTITTATRGILERFPLHLLLASLLCLKICVLLA